uniref:PB1 domain-containing protein n=1 Tax=Brassica campestris TaxID=3711 RepID=M4EMD9_BRACM
MSDSFEVRFTIYWRGKFEITEGVTSYKGGDVVQLDCLPQMLFTKMADALGNSLCGQRVWYKLPKDDFTELKLMCNGNEMFDKMLEATILCKAVQIFMEKDDDDIDGGDGDGSGDNGASGDRRSGEGDRVSGIGDNCDEEILEEDARVEKNIEGFEWKLVIEGWIMGLFGIVFKE